MDIMNEDDSLTVFTAMCFFGLSLQSELALLYFVLYSSSRDNFVSA